jgi:Domain of unknown function (DUF4920)
MKKLVLAVLLFSGISAMAQPPNVPAKKGSKFGAKVTSKGAVTPDELGNLLTDKKEADVKIKGKVVEVCKAEGCWLRMETPTGNMLIKMKDHAFLVPLVLNGKTIVAEGVATVKETTVEMLKHYAEDAGKSKAEIDAITEPKKEIVLQAKGILVL